MKTVNIVLLLILSMLLFACNANKRLMIANSKDLFDSLRLKVNINDQLLFDKRIPLEMSVPSYISKSVGRFNDSAHITVELPDIGIQKEAFAVSDDFKYIYITLFKEPDPAKMDSIALGEQGRTNKKDYFRSSISISFTKKILSPLQ